MTMITIGTATGIPDSRSKDLINQMGAGLLPAPFFEKTGPAESLHESGAPARHDAGSANEGNRGHEIPFPRIRS